jgi:hypothetical protein
MIGPRLQVVKQSWQDGKYSPHFFFFFLGGDSTGV